MCLGELICFTVDKFFCNLKTRSRVLEPLYVFFYCPRFSYRMSRALSHLQQSKSLCLCHIRLISTIFIFFFFRFRLVSAVQALLSSLAGFIVCRYSCTISFLHASHFMSEAYAWFGAAYFFYDIWSMYKVHAAQTAQKITDKLRLVKTNQKSTTLTGGTGKGDTVTGNDGNQYYDKHEKIQNTNGNANLISEKQLLMDYETSTVHVAGLEFIKYMLANPIMMIHHIFLGSFGLAVIAVSKPLLF